MSLESPTLPTSPISRPEFNRRVKAAGLMFDPDPNATFQAFNATNEGTLLVKPQEWGPICFGANRPVVFESILVQQSGSPRILARLEPGRSEGWEQLDPTYLAKLREQLEILFSPSEISLPTQHTDQPSVTRGLRVRVVRGKDAGVEGEAFWVGPSKFGDGERVGVRDPEGNKFWVSDSQVEMIEEKRPFWTPLHQACWVRDFERIDALLRQSKQWLNAPSGKRGMPDFSYSDPYFSEGTRPLHIAVAINAPETVDLLLQHGADVDVRDSLGRTPLHRLRIPAHHALNEAHLGILKRLLAAGADINSVDDEIGESLTTLTIHPAELNQADSHRVARLLLPLLAEAGADLGPLVDQSWTGRNYVLVEALAQLGFARKDPEKEDEPATTDFDFAPLKALDLFDGEAWLDERDSPGFRAAFLAAVPQLQLTQGGDGKEFGLLDALRWLENKGGPVDCPWVLDALDHDDPEVVRAASTLLRVHDRDAARREALARLAASDAPTRALAVEELGKIADPSTIADLEKLDSSETNKRVKRALKKALRLLQT